MEAKELRVGNYVNARANWNDGKHHYESAEVTEIEEDNFLTTATGIDGSCQDKERCKPIPLTEEWLLKFGFKIVVKNAEKNGVLICYNIKEKTYDFVLRDSFYNKKFTVSKLRHVHSLQNLYFALTNEELTIK